MCLKYKIPEVRLSLTSEKKYPISLYSFLSRLPLPEIKLIQILFIFTMNVNPPICKIHLIRRTRRDVKRNLIKFPAGLKRKLINPPGGLIKNPIHQSNTSRND